MKKYILGIVMTMVLGTMTVMAHPHNECDNRRHEARKECVEKKRHGGYHGYKDKKHHDKYFKKHCKKVCHYCEVMPPRRPTPPAPKAPRPRTWRGTPMINVHLTL